MEQSRPSVSISHAVNVEQALQKLRRNSFEEEHA